MLVRGCCAYWTIYTTVKQLTDTSSACKLSQGRELFIYIYLSMTINYDSVLQLEEVMFESRLNRGQKDYTHLHDNRLILLNNRLTQLVNQVLKTI